MVSACCSGAAGGDVNVNCSRPASGWPAAGYNVSLVTASSCVGNQTSVPVFVKPLASITATSPFPVVPLCQQKGATVVKIVAVGSGPAGPYSLTAKASTPASICVPTPKTLGECDGDTHLLLLELPRQCSLCQRWQPVMHCTYHTIEEYRGTKAGHLTKNG